MKKLLLLLLITFSLIANDCIYCTSGNQLIALESNDIRLDKEVLTITYMGKAEFKVDVKYTLFNEGEAKDTLIGFESIDGMKTNRVQKFFEKKHDYEKLLNAEKRAIEKFTGEYEDSSVSNFKVMVNEKKVAYKTADVAQIKKDKDTSPYLGLLYYFPVHLKKGVNTLHHTYNFDGDNCKEFFKYKFSYILDTAKRWKGGKIKDFTLILDMGENEEFSIEETFFKGVKNWSVENGRVKYLPAHIEKWGNISYKNSQQFYIYSGKVVFHQKDFVPNSAIFLTGAKSLKKLSSYIFNSEDDILPFVYYDKVSSIGKDKESLMILKAFPYARHGAIFKEKFINDYYKKCLWYEKNPKYKKTFSALEKDGKKWLREIERLKHKILRNLSFAKRGYADYGFDDSDLIRFFFIRGWYRDNSKYEAKLSDLSSSELKWREKVMAKKSIGDAEFFELITEFEKLYGLENRFDKK